ncbi:MULTISPECIES: hypothetical protein [Giesbergeria]|uniref:Uncharacterized protein n=1 Tax=Giesbergeria sinuosa TaxID=80883 RepID=A0ABV9QHZ4_9BURK
MSAATILERAQDVGVNLYLLGNEVKASGNKEGIVALLPVLRQHRVELLQLLSQQPIDQVQKAPLTPGLSQLLALAMAYCDHTGASPKARADWHSDIQSTPHGDYDGLAAYLWGQLAKRAPVAPAMPSKAIPPAPAPTTWRDADKSDQAHYWDCPQCLAVVKTGMGTRCTTGQQLHDTYIEVATRERFIGVQPDPAKPLPQFHSAQPWHEADKAYLAHHWGCDTCKAHARSNGHSDRCSTGQHLYNLYEQAQSQKEST